MAWDRSKEETEYDLSLRKVIKLRKQLIEAEERLHSARESASRVERNSVHNRLREQGVI